MRKRTAKRYNRERESKRMLHLEVSSPRIMLFRSVSVVAKMFKFVLILGLLAFAGFGLKRGVDHFFVNNPEFELKDIVLTTNGLMTKQRIIKESNIKEGDTLYSIDIKRMKSKLESMPETVSVKIDRVLPDKLVIEIVERVPVAWIEVEHLGFLGRMKENGVLIDSEGVVFPCEGKLWEIAKKLPIIRLSELDRRDIKYGNKFINKDVERAIHLIKTCKVEDGEREWSLDEVNIQNFYTLEVTCSDGVLAYFGMYDHARQFSDLKVIRHHAAQQDRSISWIDLRPEHNLPGGYESGELIKVVPAKRVHAREQE